MKSGRGFSLIEIAVLLLFMSLALIPIVNIIGGSNTVQGTGGATHGGNATRIVGIKSKEVLFANAMIERALSGEYAAFYTPNTAAGNCNGGAATMPAANTGGTTVYNCVDNQYSDPIYYQWIVTDQSNEFRANQGEVAGTNNMGNTFYRATLNIYNTDNWTGRPILTMPTIAFRSQYTDPTVSNTTGIIIVLDVSGSMDGSGTGNSAMRGIYRYPDAAGYNPPAGIALASVNDNNTLDIVSAQAADLVNTMYNDTYPAIGVLGVTNCIGSVNAVASNQAARWRALCDKTAPNYIEDNLSKMEAARGSLLNFLLTIEDEQTLYSNIQLGFATYSGNGGPASVTLRVGGGAGGVAGLENATAAGRFPEMRRRLSWLNRTNNGGGSVAGLTVLSGGNTPTWDAVNRSAQVLLAQPNLRSRAIFLVTDGLPTTGPCSIGGEPDTLAEANAMGNCYRNTAVGAVNGLGRSLGDGTYPGANGNTVTVYALGLMADPNLIRPILENGFVTPTSGSYAYASSIGEMSAVFENMQYAILKEIITSKAGRYGLQY